MPVTEKAETKFELKFESFPAEQREAMTISYLDESLSKDPVNYTWLLDFDKETLLLFTTTFVISDVKPVPSISGFRELGLPNRIQIDVREEDKNFILTIDCYMTFGPCLVSMSQLSDDQLDKIRLFLKSATAGKNFM